MTFYRYDTTYDEYNGVEIRIEEFILHKKTPKGYWIIPSWMKDRSDASEAKYATWILKSSKKRFAYPTKQEALTSFIRRKTQQIRYCKRDINSATAALRIAEKIKLEA